MKKRLEQQFGRSNSQNNRSVWKQGTSSNALHKLPTSPNENSPYSEDANNENSLLIQQRSK